MIKTDLLFCFMSVIPFQSNDFIFRFFFSLLNSQLPVFFVVMPFFVKTSSHTMKIEKRRNCVGKKRTNFPDESWKSFQNILESTETIFRKRGDLTIRHESQKFIEFHITHNVFSVYTRHIYIYIYIGCIVYTRFSSE